MKINDSPEEKVSGGWLIRVCKDSYIGYIWPHYLYNDFGKVLIMIGNSLTVCLQVAVTEDHEFTWKPPTILTKLGVNYYIVYLQTVQIISSLANLQVCKSDIPMSPALLLRLLRVALNKCYCMDPIV